MAVRRAGGLLLLGLGLALSTGSAEARPPRLVVEDAAPAHRSHIPIPGREGPLDAEKMFQERLRQMDSRAADIDKLRAELEKLAGGANAQKIIEELRKHNLLNPNDPRIKAKLEEMMRGRGNSTGSPMNLSPEEIERLTNFVKNAFPNGIGTNPNTNPGPGATPEPPKIPDPRTSPNPLPGPAIDRERTLADEKSRAEARERLLEWSRRFEGMASRLDESPALQQALRDLSKSALDMQSSRLAPEDRLDNQLANLSRFSRDSDGWMRDSFQSLRGLNLPSLPRFHVPAGSMPHVGALPKIGLPHVPDATPTLPSASDEILMMIGVCLAAVLLWKLLRWGMAVRRVRSASQWRLGPWPVDPSQVASREDVVRTFEYLSLLRLGYPAVTSNHLAIAVGLGGAADDRQQAATKLAAVYEQARYAPADEALPAEALSAARRDLCFLAGMAAP